MARRVLTALVLVLAAAPGVRASSLIPPTDLGDLVRSSDAVVLARAVSSTVEFRGRLPFTVTRFEALDWVAGQGPDEIRVVVPGGENGEAGWLVSGAPQFEAGEVYLLPLGRRGAAAWQPQMLSYGVLRRIKARDGAPVLAPVPEMAEMRAFPRPDGIVPEDIEAYRETALLPHLRAVAAGKARWQRKLVAAPSSSLPFVAQAAAVPAGCTYMQIGGQNTRWTRFDAGQTVTMYASATGDASLAGGGFAQVEGALNAWNAVAGTNMDLVYGGPSAYTMTCDDLHSEPMQDWENPEYGQNVVMFNDPCQDVAGIVGCSGTLAFGGPWASGTHTFDGATWRTITGWFVVVNDGAGCLGTTNYQRMMTHELGHGLGFGHVSDSNANMYYMCCNPINATDTMCASYAYPDPVPPAAPTGVTASDGTYTDRVRVSWSPSGGATGYTIWRATTNNTGAASQIGSDTASPYDDMTAVAGTTYYYWVKATNASGSSDFSSSDSGYRAVLTPPAAPTGVSATDGTYSDRVQVSWTAASGATGYTVWRATSDNTGAASQIGSDTASPYDDTTAVAGTTYYYWVKATNGAGSSGFSTSDSGYRALPTPPSAPTGVSATDGTYADRVRVAWNAASGATGYTIWRATSDSTGAASQIGSDTASPYDDMTAVAGTTYYYWVKATNDAGSSGFSTSDSGYRATTPTPPAPPSGVAASDGAWADRVRVTWTGSADATSYSVWRATTDSTLVASQIGTTAATSYDDMSAALGTTYYYWVRASNSYGTSGFSSSDTGYRSSGGTAPGASFTFAPSAPLVGQPVSFTDASTGSPTAWSWSFGDGSSSTSRNPSKTYSVSGSYTVVLTASNSFGSSQTQRAVTVVAAAPPLTVPVVAHNAGLSSTWRTDLMISNPSDLPLSVDLQLKESGGTLRSPKVLSLGARQSQLLEDAVATYFGADARGSVRVIPPEGGPSPAVFARNFAQEATGRLGQGIPCEQPAAAGTYYLPGLFGDPDGTGYRTNVGVTAGDREVHATFTVYRGTNGQIGGSVSRTIGTYDQQQWNIKDLFPSVAQTGVPMTVKVVLDAPALAYASLVDQVSRDSVYVPAVKLDNAFVLPLVARLPGLQGTFWRSDLALFNGTGSAVTVTLDYVPKSPPRQVTLGAGETRWISDLLKTMFGVGESEKTKGELWISANGSVAAASRTYTNTTGGSTYGHTSPAVPLARLHAGTRTLAGVRQAAGQYRTNVGVAAGSEGASATLRLYNGNGSLLATLGPYWFPPRELVQFTLSDAFGAGLPSSLSAASIQIVPDRPILAYLAVIDESTQDPALVLAP